MDKLKSSLIFLSIIILISCRKKTQETDFSAQFLNKKLWYNVTLADGTMYENDGMLHFQNITNTIKNPNDYVKADVIYNATNHSSSSGTNIYYLLPLPSKMIFLNGGFYSYIDCGTGWDLFPTSATLLFLPTLLNENLYRFKTKDCNTSKIVTITNASTEVTTPNGKHQVIEAIIKDEGKTNGILYYYNHKLGFIKIITNYNESTKKGDITYELSKVE